MHVSKEIGIAIMRCSTLSRIILFWMVRSAIDYQTSPLSSSYSSSTALVYNALMVELIEMSSCLPWYANNKRESSLWESPISIVLYHNMFSQEKHKF